MTLKKTTHAVTKMLYREDPNSKYDVSLRLYHGWHTGWERSENFKAIMRATSADGFPSDYSTGIVSFRQTVQYSHTLLHALPTRQHVAYQMNLPNTLRRQQRSLPPQEKMIDTALAADLLHWAREAPTGWALIFAEDDDVVPPVFTAEAWIHSQGGRIFIVRKRPESAFLKTNGLLRELRS